MYFQPLPALLLFKRELWRVLRGPQLGQQEGPSFSG